MITTGPARNDGSLYRSESGGDLYASYLVGPMHRKINRNIKKLCKELRLLCIGDIDRDRLIRPWLITDAGRAALDDVDKEATR